MIAPRSRLLRTWRWLGACSMAAVVGTAALAVTALTVTMPAHAAGMTAKPCAYTDLMPAYRKFAARTAGLDPEHRTDAFIHDYAPLYPNYYAPENYGDVAKFRKSALRFFDPEARGAIFPDRPALTDARIETAGKQVGRQFLREQARLLKTFPDFVCRTPVDIGVSLMKFDGHPVDVRGQQRLLFGVDMIAALHDDKDMASFFDHEIFHVYHRQLMPKLTPAMEDSGWMTMWIEGLAVYVSQRMNPSMSAQDVLWMPPDMVVRVEARKAEAAALLLRDLEKSDDQAHRWFVMSEQVDGLPYRAGYYLGYLFAKSVGDGRPLTEVARMPLEKVHAREKAFLAQLAGSAAPAAPAVPAGPAAPAAPGTSGSGAPAAAPAALQGSDSNGSTSPAGAQAVRESTMQSRPASHADYPPLTSQHSID